MPDFIFTQPDCETQNGSAYKINIENAFATLAEMAMGLMPQGLTVKNNDVTPDTKIDVEAYYVWLHDSGWVVPFYLDEALYTLDASQVGVVNGTRSALAASTQYYLFLISNGTTSGVWLDTSKTSPSFPTGYIYSRFISAPITDGSAHFLLFNQIGKKVRYRDQFGVLSSGVAAAYTGVDCITSLPPDLVAEVTLGINVVGGASGTGDLSYDGINTFYRQWIYTTGWFSSAQVKMPIMVSRTIYYRVITGNHLDIWIQGYELKM